MKYIKVKNKEDLDLTLKYKGGVFSLPANKTESFAEDVATQWVTIYGFLSLEGAEVEKVAVVAEVVEEKPEKKTKK